MGSSQVLPKYIGIKWHEAPISGYTDLLPSEDFAREQQCELVHQVRSPHGHAKPAKCLATIRGTKAILDYTPFSTFNKNHGMLLGELVIVFESAARTTVKEVLWRTPESATALARSHSPRLGPGTLFAATAVPGWSCASPR